MRVQDDGSEDGEEHVDGREECDSDAAEDDVAQETTQRSDFAFVEDDALVGKHDAGVA